MLTRRELAFVVSGMLAVLVAFISIQRRVALSRGSPERIKSVEGILGVCHWLCQCLLGYGRWWWIDGARRDSAWDMSCVEGSRPSDLS